MSDLGCKWSQASLPEVEKIQNFEWLVSLKLIQIWLEILGFLAKYRVFRPLSLRQYML
jgi:hypothetical protein